MSASLNTSLKSVCAPNKKNGRNIERKSQIGEVSYGFRSKIDKMMKCLTMLDVHPNTYQQINVSFFVNMNTQQHCRHCGTIYCEKCLTKSVASGQQRKKPARVCDVCHTLLVRNTAPYFSQAPPQSPT